MLKSWNGFRCIFAIRIQSLFICCCCALKQISIYALLKFLQTRGKPQKLHSSTATTSARKKGWVKSFSHKFPALFSHLTVQSKSLFYKNDLEHNCWSYRTCGHAGLVGLLSRGGMLTAIPSSAKPDISFLKRPEKEIDTFLDICTERVQIWWPSSS